MDFDFQPEVSDIEMVPKDFRGLYEEGDAGKFRFKSDDLSKSVISAVTGLNTALKASRAEAKDLKGKKTVDFSLLKDFGTDPETILTGFNTRLAEAGKGKHSAEDIERQVTKIRADLAQEYEVKLKGANERGDVLKKQLYNRLVTSEAMSALADAGAIKAELAMPFVANQVKVLETEDGQFLVHVVDKAGDTRYSGATSAPMSVKELVAEMKKDADFAPLWKSESSSGSGARPNLTTPTRRQQSDDADKSPLDKINAGLAARKARR